MVMWVLGLGLEIRDSALCLGLEIRIYGWLLRSLSEFGVQDSGFGVRGSGFGVRIETLSAFVCW